MTTIVELKKLDLINILIFAVSTVVLFSGILIYLRGKKTKTKAGYLITTIPMVGWGVSMFFFRASVSQDVAALWSKLLYFFPALIPLSYIYLVNSFQNFSQKYWKKQLKSIFWSIPLITYIAYITLYSDALFMSIQISSPENEIYFSKIHYLLYSIIIGVLWAVAFTLMLQNLNKSENKKESRAMQLFITGTFLSTIIAVIGNLILPFFGIFFLNWIGQVGLIIMISCTFYAVIKHNLFNLRIITAELFTYSLSALLLVRALYSTSMTSLYVNLMTLIGTIIFGFFLIRSVKKEVDAKDKAENLADQLREMNKEKSRMLSIASHQFRSPLTSIEGYSSMIQEGSYGKVPEYLKEPLGRILNSSRKLAHIVDDFLNISRIEEGRMDYNFQKTDLKEVVQEVVEESHGSINEEKLDLEFVTDESDNYPAEIDIGKFQQVITNLIDNAIKYTEKGDIIVRLKRDNSDLLVEVADEGIGIEAGKLDEIFSQFSRADEAQDVNVTGSGLGLYIAKQIVDDHDGAIWATSPGEGKGSTFHVGISAADDTNK
jgi:signal transduction histidine kinase